ncbi:MAG: Extracellular solute-binding protein family 5 [Candidatus Woesebacteria bacterium GW2011_GWA2_40_7]|uniref:Extracellular solute-binding protein family 5 n=1 Tax=Candidatus Woesebacteria bacterium GW2011_GWA2_40_7 TaxID=1618562 RepID=A0A0G0TF48_9BACT|nr:MAG: Extracellular solute-binding protein family 5 [Candidatus Woesebacteria bacterium GW2011_GWA2_40_7]
MGSKKSFPDEITDIFNPSPLDTWKKANVTTFSNAGEFVAIFFNTQDKILADKSIRQALSYAINKERFGGVRAISPISKESWAYNSQVKPYNYDLQKALETIADYKKSSKTDTLEIGITTSPILLKQAELIVKDWEALGVKVNLQVFSGIPSDYQSLLAIFDTPDDPDQYSIWHSTQTETNITRYQNPRIDKLLEDGRSQINIEDRKKTYLNFQRFLVEDSPAAFLYYPVTYKINRR